MQQIRERLCRFAWALMVAAVPGSAKSQNTVADCAPALTKDYYLDAQSRSLRLDFLRTINKEDWEYLRTTSQIEGGGGVVVPPLFGYFDFGANFEDFQQRRHKYFEDIRYNRSEQEARTIVRTVTADRAYSAYEACLRAVASDPGLRVWAARETMDRIELRVRYQNPPGVKSIKLTGTIIGGTVQGARPGRLWNGDKRWGVSEEKVFVIHRQPGTSKTSITVTPSDGSRPITLEFMRADATLSVRYPGSVEVLRQERRHGEWTPNNDHRRFDDGCPNRVGKAPGGWCISRTAVTMSTSAPRFFKNPANGCEGGGCPWTSLGPVHLGNENRLVTTSIDNWSISVFGVVKADEYEIVDEQACGPDGPIPVVKNVPVIFAAKKECMSIATLQWRNLTTGAQGQMRFSDDKSADGSVVLDGTRLDNNSVVQAAFKVVK